MAGEMWAPARETCSAVLACCLALSIGGTNKDMAMAGGDKRVLLDAGHLETKEPRQITFSWWARGGEPGPGYTSDKLDLEINGQSIVGTYIRARFDANFDPPFLSEQFTSQVPEQLYRDLVEALENDRAFSSHFVSEDRSNLADAIKDTIRLTIGERSDEKTLYESDKSELAASKAARNAIVKYLYDRGKKTIRNQGTR